MKHFKYLLLIVLSMFFIYDVNAQDIKSIEMDINIDRDGVAHVTENWTIYTGENEDLTEIYKPYYNYGKSEFKNFKVSLNNREFTYINNWDVDESFDYKSYKNGFNYISDGVELCFGISTKGTTNTYKMSYDITNFVAGLNDSDMVYWNLIPKNLSDSPEQTYIKIYSDFSYSNDLPVWGYGNYGGYAYVYDGYIEMSLDRNLDKDEYMTILVKFPKDTFDTSNNKIDENFDYYYNMAEDGAENYGGSGVFSSIFNFILENLFLILIIIFALFGGFYRKSRITTNGSYKIKYGKEGKKIPKDIPYFRDIPCNKDIYRAYWIAKNYKIVKKDTDFLGVVLLKWINEGIVRVEKKKKKGIFKKEESSLVLDKTKTITFQLEQSLFNMIDEASIDGVLEAKEFKTWASNNYTEIYDWFKRVLDYQTIKLYEEGKLTKISNSKYEVTSGLLEEAKQLAGLKKFLKEFSRIHERSSNEVHLWKEYLMYAQMFGIAEEVAKELREIYPDVIPEDYIDDYFFITYVSFAGINSASTAKTRAESYNSGGGGFSSGGGGFGSFGGGFGGGGGR